MPEPLDEAVAHLRALSIHLNEVTDRATAAVRRVEGFLNDECRLGLAAYVTVSASGPDTPTLQLGYARHGERYRIVVRTQTWREQDGKILRREGGAPLLDGEEQIAWSECPRGPKLEAFQRLPDLLTAVQDQVAKTIARADAAVSAAQRITGALGPAPEPVAGEEEGKECKRDEGRGRHRHDGHHGHHHDGRRGEGRGERDERRERDDRDDRPRREGRGWDRA